MTDSRTQQKTSNRRKPSDNRPKSPSRRGRPVGNHEEKRAELLKAAISVIADEGYARASMRKVAKRAGCTTGAVTYYFANKAEMVTAVAKSLFDIFNATLIVHQEHVDIRAGFVRWLEWTKADDPAPWLALFQLLAHARHEPAFADVFQELYAQYRKSFASIIAKGQREGLIRDDIPANLLADQLSAIGDGWMMMYPIEPERFKPSRMKALLNSIDTLLAPTTRKR